MHLEYIDTFGMCRPQDPKTHLGPAGWFMNAWNLDVVCAAAALVAWADIVEYVLISVDTYKMSWG